MLFELSVARDIQLGDWSNQSALVRRKMHLVTTRKQG